ncbi:MAG: hypothetical protein ACREO8_13210 [Luteimonas sp.]
MARPPQKPLERKPVRLDAVRLDHLRTVGVTGEPPPTGGASSETTVELMKEVESILAGDATLDRETRDALQQHFSTALNVDAASPPVAADFDSGMWADAVHALQSGGVIAQDEANELIRQLNQALEPLKRRESRLAIGYSRRIGTDGPEKALEWFRREAAKSQQEPTISPQSAPTSGAVPPPLRGDVVNSRSRRLRGPPRIV